MIKFKCNNCGYEIKTYDKFAGKRVRCPKCKEPLQLPPSEGGIRPKEAAIIKFRCPNCNQKIGLPPKYAAKVVRCAKCEHRLQVPQAPGAAAQPKPQNDLAALRVGQEQPAVNEGGMPGLGDMSDLLQLEASAPAIEEPLRLSPVEDTTEEGAAAAYASQFSTRPSFQGDEGEGKKKNKLVVPIVIAAVCIVVVVIGYMAISSFMSGLDTIGESQADVDFDAVQQFTETYIGLLADGDVNAAEGLLSPRVKVFTDKEQIERLTKLVGEKEIIELEMVSAHFEEELRGGQYYLWYKLSYEEGTHVFIASVREVGTGFAVDGIAAKGMPGQTEVIGNRSFIELSEMAVVSKVKAASNIIAKSFCGIMLVFLVIAVIQVIAMWVLFEKAGHPGWAAIVPFYSMWVLAEVGDKSGWTGLAMCFCGALPVVGPMLQMVLWITISIGVAKTFERGTSFGIGMGVLPFIFYPILAFSRD